MKKFLAALGICAALFLGTVGPADADTAAAQAQSQDQADDDSGDKGLWGLAGLLGLAGLAGLKRRDPVDRDDRYATSGATNARARTTR
jgi:MYXO-CTERM domain-containing protein